MRPPQSPSQSCKLSVLRLCWTRSGVRPTFTLRNLYRESGLISGFGQTFHALYSTLKSSTTLVKYVSSAFPNWISYDSSLRS